MKNSIGIAVIAIAVFVGWLQYNTDFQTTGFILLGLGIFGGFIVVALIVLAVQRSSNDAIIRHDEAMSLIRVEEMRVQREERKHDTIILRNSTAMAKQQVREMLPYCKAQLEAKYQPVGIEDAEFRPLEYGEDEL